MSRKQWNVVVCMLMGYGGLMMCKTVFSVLTPALVDSAGLGMSRTDIGAILGYGAIGTIIGKLGGGIITDHLGGRISLVASLFIVSVLTMTFSLARYPALFSLIFLTLMIFRAAGWPAMANSISEWIPRNRYGSTWGMLSSCSRISVIVTTLVVGALLSRFPWPWLFVLVGIVGLAMTFAMYLIFPKKEERREKTFHFPEILKAWLGFAKSPRCWLVCLSISLINMLMGFVDFVPLYLNDNFAISTADAGFYSYVFPLGCLVSVLIGGYFYDRFTRKQLVYVTGTSLLGGTICLAVLFALPQFQLSETLNLDVAMGVIFLLGFSVAPAYYLPMSVFAIEYGRANCGSLISLIDLCGYATLAVFSFTAGYLMDQPNGWHSLLYLMLVISFSGAVATMAFLYSEYRFYAKEIH